MRWRWSCTTSRGKRKGWGKRNCLQYKAYYLIQHERCRYDHVWPRMHYFDRRQKSPKQAGTENSLQRITRKDTLVMSESHRLQEVISRKGFATKYSVTVLWIIAFIHFLVFLWAIKGDCVLKKNPKMWLLFVWLEIDIKAKDKVRLTFCIL